MQAYLEQPAGVMTMVMQSPHAQATADMTQYLAGFVFGMTEHDHSHEIQHCLMLDDPEDYLHKVQVASDDVYEGRYFKGVRYFSTILWQFPMIFINCPEMLDDVLYMKAWSQVFTEQPNKLAERVSKNWIISQPEILAQIIVERQDILEHKFFGAGDHSARALRYLIGGEASHSPYAIANHSSEKDLLREPDFLAGYLCGLQGVCDLQPYLAQCMHQPMIPEDLKDSLDAMVEGVMHGQVMDNLIMGLFNLDFLMNDYEELVHALGCTDISFERDMPEWQGVRHGITHESMAQMQAKIGLHLEDARQSSHAVAEAWASQDYFTAGQKTAEIAKIATHDCLDATQLLLN